MKNVIYGYARISRPTQDINRQIRNIKAEYPDAVIVEEIYTGTKQDRPKWDKLYRKVKSGDTIIFDSVSRMSRTADEGFAEYEKLYMEGVNLVFLKEPHVNTDTYKKAMDAGIPMTGTNVDFILDGVNKYLMALAKEQIRLAYEQAEKEVKDLQQRTKEGIETARLKGKQIGTPKGTKLTTKKSLALKKLIVQYSKDFNGNNTDAEVISIINGMSKIVYDTQTEIITNPDTGIEEKKITELTITPHNGLTEQGNQKNRFINRATYYKYKRELKQEV